MEGHEGGWIQRNLLYIYWGGNFRSFPDSFPSTCQLGVTFRGNGPPQTSILRARPHALALHEGLGVSEWQWALLQLDQVGAAAQVLRLRV